MKFIAQGSRLLSHSLVIYRFNWTNGKGDGTEEQFDEASGNLIYRATAVDGKYDGERVQYMRDGKTLVYRATFKNGILDGPYEENDPSTGASVRKTVFKAGVDQVAASGTQGVQTSSGGNSSSLDACVDAWTSAHRAVVGKEAAISVDQLSEWEAWCKEGKRPER